MVVDSCCCGALFRDPVWRKEPKLYAANYSLGELLTHPKVVQLCAGYMDFLPQKRLSSPNVQSLHIFQHSSISEFQRFQNTSISEFQNKTVFQNSSMENLEDYPGEGKPGKGKGKCCPSFCNFQYTPMVQHQS